MQARSENFYGVTALGGSNGQGTIFEITPGGNFTNLHNFSGAEGSNAVAALIQASNGNFYGTTSGGVTGYGTLFRVTSTGGFKLLHTFDNKDGADSVASLIEATDGSLYGPTAEGGTYGFGTVFKLTTAGLFKTVYSLGESGTDGKAPYAPLIQIADGSFYGTTTEGGLNDAGTVFKLVLD